MHIYVYLYMYIHFDIGVHMYMYLFIYTYVYMYFFTVQIDLHKKKLLIFLSCTYNLFPDVMSNFSVLSICVCRSIFENFFVSFSAHYTLFGTLLPRFPPEKSTCWQLQVGQNATCDGVIYMVVLQVGKCRPAASAGRKERLKNWDLSLVGS